MARTRPARRGAARRGAAHPCAAGVRDSSRPLCPRCGMSGPPGAVECDVQPFPTTGPAPMPDLFDPLRVKSWELPNRLVMAPLTRNRATEGMVPDDLAVEYYRQRASAGLIISEGTQPSAVGQ